MQLWRIGDFVAACTAYREVMHPMEQLRFVARAGGADSSLLVAESAQALSMFAHEPQALLVACKQLLTRQPTVGGLWWVCSRMLMAADPRSEARAVVADLRSDMTSHTLARILDEMPRAGSGPELPITEDGVPGCRVLTLAWPDVVVEALASTSASVLIVEIDGVGSGAVRRLDRHGVEGETVAAERMAGAAAAADIAVIEAAAVGARHALVDVGGRSLAAVAASVGTPVWLVVPPWRIVPHSIWADVVAGQERWRGPAWMAPSELVPIDLVDAVISGKERSATHLDDGRAIPVESSWSAAPELTGLVSSRSR